MRVLSLLLLKSVLLYAACPVVVGEEVTEKDRPIQALLVTGGCCHDYDRQKLILTRGISARADVRWTVVHQGGSTTNTPIPLYNDPDWADGFDIVVHNECFSDVKDLEFVDRILQPHKDGLPAILIHCAMHCYRVEDDRWFRFVGMQSPGHGPHYSYTADNVQPDHPIMHGFGPKFVAPKGELYHSMKVFDTATPLAQANREADGQPQVCVWTNDYNGTRVFGCTMGHYNETMAEPKYLDMMARAVLWATKRDVEQDFTPSTEKIDDEIRALVTAPVVKASGGDLLPGNCCGDGNLAFGKPVTSKSEQDGNFRKHLTDGRLGTRYCPNGSQINEWCTVDLEEPQHVAAIRLHWEKQQGIAYRYIVEVSQDNENWKQVVDKSQNEEVGGIRVHQIDADDVRYIRTTFLGASRGLWGSLWELEATAGELPDISHLISTSDAPPASIVDVKTPPGFHVTLFGTPPEVNYPVCLTAAVTGEVFVGVDEQGSLGKEPGRGKVLRCIDTDGDGQADQINEFAKMDHPRGLIYDRGALWVLHPPFLSVYRDTDGDGTSDESEVLIDGISTDDVAKRGADHTTNGIRMGIDGWIYIAVGDFGFTKAVAKDGTTLSRRGGGIVRIRPNGTEMEIYSWGQRNILDVAIDPYMNIFTRDNTNDGGGWDIRVSHILQTADYGYPSLYKNFTEEIMPPLADYGGGSGCGAMYFQDARWPEQYRDLLLTCDWGTSRVYSHKLPPNGATFDPQQDVFLQLPRPTDIDVDGSGRMYVSSWKNGKFAYDGPDVGFVAQITPVDFTPKPVPSLSGISDVELVALLRHPSAAYRSHVQPLLLSRESESRELLSAVEVATGPRDPHGSVVNGKLYQVPRGDIPQTGDDSAAESSLAELASDSAAELYARVAAIYTYKQLKKTAANSFLLQLATKDKDVREHCLRAVADRRTQLEGITPQPFLDGLSDANPRVQAAALIGLGRIMSWAAEKNYVVTDAAGTKPVAALLESVANAILPLTVSQSAEVTVKGTVTLDGQSVADAKIEFSGGKGNAAALTDKDGKYSLKAPGPGTQKVRITLPHAKSAADAESATAATSDAWRQPNPARVLPHLAVKALVAMNAVKPCLAAVDGPYRDGALWALKSMHSRAAVDGLFRLLSSSHDEELHRAVWTTLIRLYHREADYKGGWWGTRPDTTGPYYDRQPWSESARIADAVRVALSEADNALAAHIKKQLQRHVVRLDGISAADIAAAKEPESAIQLPKADPANPAQIANRSWDDVLSVALNTEGSAAAGEALFRSQSCINCHTFANGQQPRGPHLVGIGKRYNKAELIESIVEPGKKIAQGFDTWSFVKTSGKIVTGFVVLESAETVTVRQTDGLSREILQDDIEDRVKQKTSMMPTGLVGNLTPQQLADLIAWLQTLH